MSESASTPGALLTIDIAFDWDSKSKDQFYDGFCLTGASGFDMALAGRPPAHVRGLNKADQLQFAIYDISDQTANRSVSDLVIQLRSAHDANTSEYPFDPSMMGKRDADGWYPIANLAVVSAPGRGGESGVYGGPYPIWSVSPSPIPIVSAGWFFFKVSLKATQDSKRRTFGNDPEMIVGPDF